MPKISERDPPTGHLILVLLAYPASDDRPRDDRMIELDIAGQS
jgi:hypothetical protein